MTGKLIKYEIRSSCKLIAIIWAALIVASLLFSFTGDHFMNIMLEGFSNSAAASIMTLLTGILYFALFMAMMAVSVMVIIMRFYKGLLGDEGYLMHTLPVKPWQLITSKGIVSVGVLTVSVIVGIISIMILGGIADPSGLSSMLRGLANDLGEDPFRILILIEAIVIVIMSLLKSIYQVYAALAIGQLTGKHRILLAFGAYVGISIALSIITFAVTLISAECGIANWIDEMFRDGQRTMLSQLGMLTVFLFTLLQLAAFHVVTERILTKKLNLQ